MPATFVSKGHGIFAHIHGTLHADNDRTVIERLWNPFVASWYRDGQDVDPGKEQQRQNQAEVPL